MPPIKKIPLQNIYDVKWTEEKVHAMSLVSKRVTITSKTYSKQFKKEFLDYRDYRIWYQVISREMMAYLLDGHWIEFPMPVGTIGYGRRKRKYPLLNSTSTGVNWPESKKLHKKVYYDVPEGARDGYFSSIICKMNRRSALYRLKIKRRSVYGSMYIDHINTYGSKNFPDVTKYTAKEAVELISRTRKPDSEKTWKAYYKKMPFTRRAGEVVNISVDRSAELLVKLLAFIRSHAGHVIRKQRNPFSYSFFCFTIEAIMTYDDKYMMRDIANILHVKSYQFPSYNPITNVSKLPTPIKTLRAAYISYRSKYGVEGKTTKDIAADICRIYKERESRSFIVPQDLMEIIIEHKYKKRKP